MKKARAMGRHRQRRTALLAAAAIAAALPAMPARADSPFCSIQRRALNEAQARGDQAGIARARQAIASSRAACPELYRQAFARPDPAPPRPRPSPTPNPRPPRPDPVEPARPLVEEPESGPRLRMVGRVPIPSAMVAMADDSRLVIVSSDQKTLEGWNHQTGTRAWAQDIGAGNAPQGLAMVGAFDAARGTFAASRNSGDVGVCRMADNQCTWAARTSPWRTLIASPAAENGLFLTREIQGQKERRTLWNQWSPLGSAGETAKDQPVLASDNMEFLLVGRPASGRTGAGFQLVKTRDGKEVARFAASAFRDVPRTSSIGQSMSAMDVAGTRFAITSDGKVFYVNAAAPALSRTFKLADYVTTQLYQIHAAEFIDGGNRLAVWSIADAPNMASTNLLLFAVDARGAMTFQSRHAIEIPVELAGGAVRLLYIGNNRFLIERPGKRPRLFNAATGTYDFVDNLRRPAEETFFRARYHAAEHLLELVYSGAGNVSYLYEATSLRPIKRVVAFNFQRLPGPRGFYLAAGTRQGSNPQSEVYKFER